MTDNPSLSIVIPALNEGPSIVSTLNALGKAIDVAELDGSVEIVLVDDGSTDSTQEIARDAGLRGLKIVSQPNSGRFEARRTGIELARGQHILLLDARVEVSSGSLREWREQMRDHPERRAWCGAVKTVGDGNPYGVFWEVIARIGWSGYRGKLISYGPDEFDRFPKGTGFFLVDREPLLESLAERSAANGGIPPKFVSDDTALLRAVIERTKTFWISPAIGGVHTPSRRWLGAFVSNTFYRGTTFIDSYAGVAGMWGNFARFFLAVFAAGLVGLVFAISAGYALAALLAVAALVLMVCTSIFLRARRSNGFNMSLLVALVTIPFGIFFVLGMARGWFYRLRPGS